MEQKRMKIKGKQANKLQEESKIIEKLRLADTAKNPSPDAGELSGSTYGIMDGAAHAEQLLRFHAHQGHGYAAEQANHLLDRLQFKDAQLLGNDNAKNGPDRMVDGMLIQSKYCQNARATVEAAFQNQSGLYRYIGKDGMPMQLEVPSDQYEEAVEIMQKKIMEGKIPGIQNPNAASKLVRKGNIDYQTACNIAKAGTIDSLVFDAAHGSVIAMNAFGISAVITMARCLWSGQSLEQAIDNAVYSGLQVGGAAFISSVISAQLARTSLNAVIQRPVVGIIRALPPVARKSMLATLEKGAAVYGGGTAGNLAKLWSSNIITSAVFTLVLSASDITHFFQGKISGKQLFKNVTTIIAGTGGTVAGAAIGTVFGPIGMIAGGLAGGVLAGKGTANILNHFIEDDAVAMVRILNERMIVQAQHYLLDQEELNLVLEDLQIQLVRDKLLLMFASEDRQQFADTLLISIIEPIIHRRARILLPSEETFIAGLGRILSFGNNAAALQEYLKGTHADTVAIGKKLLQREVSPHAADRAWYATRQMNLINSQQEVCLDVMKTEEARHLEKIRQQQKELQELQEKLQKTLED